MWQWLSIMALIQQKNNYDSNQTLNENEHKIIEFIATLFAIWFKLLIVTALLLVTATFAGFYGFAALMILLGGIFTFKLLRFRKGLSLKCIFSQPLLDIQYYVVTYAIIIQAIYSFVKIGNNRVFMANWLKPQSALYALWKISVEYIYVLPFFLVILIAVPKLEYVYRRFVMRENPFCPPFGGWKTNLFLIWGAYSFCKIFLFAYIFR